MRQIPTSNYNHRSEAKCKIPEGSFVDKVGTIPDWEFDPLDSNNPEIVNK